MEMLVGVAFPVESSPWRSWCRLIVRRRRLVRCPHIFHLVLLFMCSTCLILRRERYRFILGSLGTTQSGAAVFEFTFYDQDYAHRSCSISYVRTGLCSYDKITHLSAVQISQKARTMHLSSS
ncbi:hypothetical protein PHLGIDRAFT_244696 [Phlebiopsis gigantea 11061_1 CR5-6]|uniref:Uncharacterized protein n=1 Tax=Phlebiopsis gigantea (strain 11061_1 CR5-6) TaxID=745531 RepID=A0A0C3S552_PHLG1|nr:hypothetical protein PHLGIDRAFT_244696 [Phlebiopsis gigantea 11061_1 CR5-6]